MKGILKKLAIGMATIMLVTTINVPQPVNAAKVPTLNVSKKTITGKGKTYKIYVKNQKAGCKYTWTSSNKKIATVTAVKGKKGTATVKAVKAGTANISCKITYPSGTKRTLKAKITVKIPKKVVKVPATGIKFSNAKLENNVQKITLGQSYDFNTTYTPTNSTDKTFFSIVPSDAGTITDAGVFTPTKLYETVNIYAVAAETKEAAAKSTVKDMINVKVVPKSASVASVSMKGADEVLVTFSMPVNPATVLDSTTKQLTSAIVIAPAKDSNGKQGADFGTLTPTLSTDGMSLSIKCSKAFNGSYTISISSDVKAQDGTAFTDYAKKLSLVDKEPPVYIGTTVDDSGLISSLNFNEALDVSGMTIADVRCNNTTMTSIEEAALKRATNYSLSKDKKSLTLDLTSIVLADTNSSKTYTIQIQGIKDVAGNLSNSNFITATVIVDTTLKPQAVVVNITRSSYQTLTVEFSRAIRPYETGNVRVNNGTPIYMGSIDVDNKKLVHYTLPAEATVLTGPQTVEITGWRAYNCNDYVTTPTKRTVNFTADTSAPSVVKAQLLTTGGQYTMVLEYTKPVTVTEAKGTIAAKITTSNQDIDGNILTYTATVSDKVVTVILDNRQMALAGTYEFKLPEGFVKDAFLNKSAKIDLALIATATSDSKLPAPITIQQSIEDKNIIQITFENKLDIVSAENLANYTISGVRINKAKVEKNTQTLAIVELTVDSGSIPFTSNYKITINGVKGFQDTFNPIEDYSTTIPLNENVAPHLTGAVLTNGNQIVLSFSEAVTGTPSFNVYKDGVLIAKPDSMYTYSDTTTKTVTLQVYQSISSASGVVVVANTDNRLIDTDGNTVQINSTIYVR